MVTFLWMQQHDGMVMCTIHLEFECHIRDLIFLSVIANMKMMMTTMTPSQATRKHGKKRNHMEKKKQKNCYCIIHWHHLQINEVLLIFFFSLFVFISVCVSQCPFEKYMNTPFTNFESTNDFEENELRQIADLFVVIFDDFDMMNWQASERACAILTPKMCLKY